jgi:hypothetical protein
MRNLKVLAAVALIGGTLVACTDEAYYGNRAYYGATPSSTQYVYSPAPAYTAYPATTYSTYPRTAYTAYPASSQTSWRNDRDGDGVPNYRDRAPDNSYYR